MAHRKRYSPTIHLALLFPLIHAAAFAQQEPTTADQVVNQYLEAVGASHFSSVTTLMEIGDLDGNLGNLTSGAVKNGEHGTFEYYFKSPNLRFNSEVSDNKVIAFYGCDGKTAWYIDATLNRMEIKPKAGGTSECEAGFKPALSTLSDSKRKMRLLKKKAVAGSMAWAVKIDDRISRPETFYFDTVTFLLLRKTSVAIPICLNPLPSLEWKLTGTSRRIQKTYDSFSRS